MGIETPLPESVVRQRMVSEQLVARGISDPRVIDAFLKVERHLFVPEKERPRACEDFPLPIGEGQTISQPYMAALMTEQLKLRGHVRILEIGTGCGYQSAILAHLGCRVFSVEYRAGLAERAGKLLHELGYDSVRVRAGDGSLGWPEEAPFDRILVAAGAPGLPEPLVGQLGRGGRMVIPLGGEHTQMLTLVEKKDTGIETTDICECAFVPLRGAHGWKG